MKRKLTFLKEKDNRWYLQLPEWEGDKKDLEMVAGADDMCNILSQGENEVTVWIGDRPLTESEELILEGKCSDVAWELDGQDSPTSGAFYRVTKLKGVEYNFTIWLCDVTKFIFGKFPERLYIR